MYQMLLTVFIGLFAVLMLLLISHPRGNRVNTDARRRRARAMISALARGQTLRVM